MLFRTAEYLTAGYFHNSQTIAVDHAKKKATFLYKNWFDVRTKEKNHSTITIDIYEFMAKMRYFPLKKHQKMIRYYGIYDYNAEQVWYRMRMEYSLYKRPYVGRNRALEREYFPEYSNEECR